MKRLLTRCCLDQPEGFRDVETLGRQQDGGDPARGLHQLMHARAMRERRHHQRGVLFRRARREIGEMVGDDKGHLAVGQHRRLGAAGGAGGEEEPAGIVMLDRDVRDRRAGMRRHRLAQRASRRSVPVSPIRQVKARVGDSASA